MAGRRVRGSKRVVRVIRAVADDVQVEMMDGAERASEQPEPVCESASLRLEPELAASTSRGANPAQAAGWLAPGQPGW